jgi:hypothetical protein
MGHEQLLLFTEMGAGNPFHGRLFVVQSRYMTPVQKRSDRVPGGFSLFQRIPPIPAGRV